MKNNVIILIPAYNPDITLKKLIEKLTQNGYFRIIVVNDGSICSKVFENISNDVTILEHKQNRGKGRALKTGINYCIQSCKDILGIITVDADGQHLIEDINRIYETFIQNKNSIVLGCRNFHSKNVPLKSKIGNIIFNYIFYKKTRIKIKDTQTGLRAIPSQYLREIEKIEGERFEYETNMLLYCIRNKINILEVAIQEIYIQKNKNTNFKSLIDSIRICKTLQN